MDTKLYFNDIYKDFFRDKNIEESYKGVEQTEEVINIKDDFEYIDNLFLNDESKELLKKIIDYMKRYSEKSELNYLNFNITLESNDKELRDKIVKLIEKCANKYKYVDNSGVNELSFYKFEKLETLDEIYKNGIIVVKDLDAFNMNEDNFKKKFIYSFEEKLLTKNITIVCDKKDSIKTFYQNDDMLENKYFNFRLVGIKPNSNDIYLELINKISNLSLGEEFNIKVLDYVSNTYDKSDLSYSVYIDNLYRYISFNKDVPKIEEIKSTEEIFKDLNELVGLSKVKKSLNDLVDLITLKSKTSGELKINDVNLHMVFLGNPGTGKTTVARMLAEILYNLKYIKQNKLIEVSSKDLVAEYVGQTAPKTMSVVEKAMGGILFIDEAYALASKDGSNTYNEEAIATLIKAMEDYRDNLVVIFAGYSKEMQAFLDTNSGIVSRIGYTMEFEDYTTDELELIFKGMVKKSGFELEEEAISVLRNIIDENKNNKNFGNARFVRNVFEKSVLKHAANTKDKKNKKLLKTLTAKDITVA